MKAMQWVLVGVLFLAMGCGPCRRIFTGESLIFKPTKDATVVKVMGTIDSRWALEVEKAAAQENTKIVVLWIESGGGYVNEALLLSHNLRVVRQKHNKPIYIYTEYILASGAYWVAVEADFIWMSPTALVGSIGVYSERLDVSEFDSKNGVKYYYFYGGARKVEGNPHLKLTEGEAIEIGRGVLAVYKKFVIQVAKNRFETFQRILSTGGIPADTMSVIFYVEQLADGSVYGASEGLASGLVDGVAYFDEFCDLLRKMGYTVRKLDGTEVETLYK